MALLHRVRKVSWKEALNKKIEEYITLFKMNKKTAKKHGRKASNKSKASKVKKLIKLTKSRKDKKSKKKK